MISHDSTPLAPWPQGPREGVPGPDAAAEYALEVRRRVLGSSRLLAPLRDLTPCYRAGRFRVRERQLSGHAGGDEGLLLPAPRDRFDVWIDPTPRGGWESVPPHIKEPLRRHRARFRTAHELAHSFFFDRGHGTPRRRQRNSVRQEDFCDAFARALLVPPPAAGRVAPSADAVIRLQRRFDVSLEVAARALAGAHPGVLVFVFYWQVGREIAASTASVQWQSSAVRVDDAITSVVAQAVGASRTIEVDRCSARYLPRRRQAIVISPA